LALAARGSGAALALLAALCPATAEAQSLSYCDMAFFNQTAYLKQNGDTSVVMSGERKKVGIRLTEEKLQQRGTAFHELPIAFLPGTSLYLHFRMRISGAAANMPPNGAEGLTFIVQNDPGGDPLGVGKFGTGKNAIGAADTGMSYEGIIQSLALEFDTSKSAQKQDPDGNHMALNLGGMMAHTADGTSMGMPLMGMPSGSSVMPRQPLLLGAMQSLESVATNYDTRDVWIDYECSAPNACTMKVYMTWNAAATAANFTDVLKPGTLPIKPAEPVMAVENLEDISSYLKSPTGFVGFSAATSMSMSEHLVTFWMLDTKPLIDLNQNNLEDACECTDGGGQCAGKMPICPYDVDEVTEVDPPKPAFNGYCRSCQADVECGVTNNQKPICDEIDVGGTGECVECMVDGHCLNPDEPFCNPAVKECTGKCTNDDMCSEDEWCDNPSAEAFGGDCLPDLANGEPIPTSAMHTPPLEGVCTPDAAQVVCASRVCDEADNLCGYAVGTGPCNPATAQVVCRSGVCDANEVCGCTTDSQCGDPMSGKVCDTVTETALNQCIDGCRGPGEGGIAGNGCPPDFVCTSMDETIGKCVKPEIIPGPKVTGGYVEGAGLIQCGAARRGGAGQVAAVAVLAALAGHLVRRRRRGHP
jgi:hypothetical protein